MKRSIPESIGKRIARLRQEHGYTQQTLAERLAISRVAVSHIEADLTIPSERTVTLLAGLFKCAPLDLVEGTTYPQAKAERLPYIVAWYTQMELELEILRNDLDMISRMHRDKRIVYFVLGKWAKRLAQWEKVPLDEKERELLVQARAQLKMLEKNN